MAICAICFNPRARVGRDGRVFALLGDRVCFNPRARVGRDIGKEKVSNRERVVSIHAPAWGATLPVRITVWVDSFQSTRPRGARPATTDAFTRATTGFNPRARVGRDTQPHGFVLSLNRFNPRARVGRDLRN